jgi:hypothetical protein
MERKQYFCEVLKKCRINFPDFNWKGGKIVWGVSKVSEQLIRMKQPIKISDKRCSMCIL